MPKKMAASFSLAAIGTDLHFIEARSFKIYRAAKPCKETTSCGDAVGPVRPSRASRTTMARGQR